MLRDRIINVKLPRELCLLIIKRASKERLIVPDFIHKILMIDSGESQEAVDKFIREHTLPSKDK